MATAVVDIFPGSIDYDWVSYAGSTDTAGVAAGVSVDLGSGTTPATVSEAWAAGDTLTNINNVIGSEADDTLAGNNQDNILSGGAGADTLTGGEGADTLTGGEGADTLTGGEGADTLTGGEGADTLTGGEGEDTLTGGAGEDTASYEFASEGVRVDLSRTEAQIDFDGTHGFSANTNEAVGDILTEIQHITGSDHNDWLTGDDTSNDLQGGAGNDVLAGGAGEDSYLFNTGDGTDIVTDDGGKIVFLQGTNNDYVGAAYTFSRANFGNSETVILTVTKNGNILNVLEFAIDPTSDYAFTTRDTDGIDSKIDSSLFVVPPRLGSEQNPFLATAVVDIFPGSIDYDWVSYENSEEGVRIALDDNANPAVVSEGWATGDSLTNINNVIGSDHRDVFRGNSDANIFYGGDGIDSLHGGAGADTLYGGGGINSLFGGAGADTLYGGDNIDRLEGGAGADTIDGGGGNNYASYVNSDKGVRIDLALTGAQQDFLSEHGFTSNNNEAVGDIFIRIGHIRGSNHDDWLTGNDRNNEFYAREGNDRISGGAGDDYLSGGADADTMDGGLDRDTAGYRGATRAVRVNLLLQGQRQEDFTTEHGFAANNNDAVGDTLTNIENIRGSDYNDWLTGDGASNSITGDRGDDLMRGGGGDDTYVFASGDGTDTIDDDGGKIIFEQGAGNDYRGAVYTFTRANEGRGEAVTLTVSKDGNTLNVIAFASDPLPDYDFTTRIGIMETAIPASSLVVPARQNSQGSPALFDPLGSGSDTYIFEAGDGKEIIQGEGDGLGNSLIFRAPSGETYTNSNFDFDRGNWDEGFTEESTGDDLLISVSLGTDTFNSVVIEDYFDQQDDAYTIYRTSYGSSSDGTIVSTQPAETS